MICSQFPACWLCSMCRRSHHPVWRAGPMGDQPAASGWCPVDWWETRQRSWPPAFLSAAHPRLQHGPALDGRGPIATVTTPQLRDVNHSAYPVVTLCDVAGLVMGCSCCVWRRFTGNSPVESCSTRPCWENLVCSRISTLSGCCEHRTTTASCPPFMQSGNRVKILHLLHNWMSWFQHLVQWSVIDFRLSVNQLESKNQHFLQFSSFTKQTVTLSCYVVTTWWRTSMVLTCTTATWVSSLRPWRVEPNLLPWEQGAP